MELLKKKNLERIIKKEKRNKSLISLQNARTIGFVHRNPNSLIIKKWKEGLARAGKEVEECVFLKERLKKGQEPAEGLISIYKNHLALNGNIKLEKGKVFLHQKFDILVSFGKNHSIEEKICIAQSHAKLKIGVHTKENERIQDLLINLSEDYKDEAFILALEKNLKLLT